MKKEVNKKEREEQEKLDKIEKEKREKNFERQIKMVLIIGGILIVSVLVVYFLSIESKKFHFLDLTFTEKPSGNLMFYYTEIPLKNADGKQVGKIPVYLREDPRKLARIDIEGDIRLKKNVAITEEQNLRNCSDSVIAIASTSGFLASAGIDPIFVSTNKTEANETKIPYANCEIAENNGYSFVQFTLGAQTKITQKGNCFAIETANCEIMNASERFELGVYAWSKGLDI